jgi:hypothetical protein
MKMSEESIKMAVFWDVVPRILVKIDWRFRGAYCLHHQDDESRNWPTFQRCLLPPSSGRWVKKLTGVSEVVTASTIRATNTERHFQRWYVRRPPCHPTPLLPDFCQLEPHPGTTDKEIYNLRKRQHTLCTDSGFIPDLGKDVLLLLKILS